MKTINQVATEAARLTEKKPSKREAFELMRDVIRHTQGSAGHDYALVRLYQFFAPAPPKTPKTAFDWVASAAGVKDALRPQLHYVKCCGPWLTATDGHTLHRAPNESGLPAGMYDVAGTRVDTDLKFPDCERVIPKDGERTPLDVRSVDVVEVTDKIQAYVLPDYADEGRAFDRRLIDRAITGLSNPEAHDNSNARSFGPLKITGDGGRLAVVTPLVAN